MRALQQEASTEVSQNDTIKDICVYIIKISSIIHDIYIGKINSSSLVSVQAQAQALCNNFNYTWKCFIPETLYSAVYTHWAFYY